MFATLTARSDSCPHSRYPVNVYQSIAPLHANSNQIPPGRSPPEIFTSTNPSHPGNAFFPVLATLPSDVHAFINIPDNQFESVRDFLRKNPGFLDSTRLSTMVDNVANEAAAANDDTLLKQCIQRRIIVRQCRKVGGYDPDYLNRLIERNSAVMQHFSKACTELSTSIKRKTATDPANTTVFKAQAPSHSYTSIPKMSIDQQVSGGSSFHTPSAPQPSPRPGEDIRYGSRYPVTPGPFDTRINEAGVPHNYPVPGISDFSASRPQTSAADDTNRGISHEKDWGSCHYEPGDTDRGPSRRQPDDQYRQPSLTGLYDDRGSAFSNTSVLPTQRQRRPSQPTARHGAQNNFGPMYTTNSQQGMGWPVFGTTQLALDQSTTIRRDQFPDPEPIDPRYKTQNGRTFFTKGQVFAMMFPEPKGVNPRTLDTGPDDSRFTIKDRHGQEIFSHKKRFVVIREREGHCLCIPINSYRRTGVGRKSIPQKEKRAHAIIYDNKKRAPRLILPGEDAITKKAIAVDLDDKQTLDETSRIHFGKVYTIEWNVKVMRIGQITPRSERDVEEYWKGEVVR